MKNNSTLSLGEKIKQVRNAMGISQENMAHAIKSSKSFVQRLEQGQVECSAEMLAKIKKFLEIENAPLLEHELIMYRNRIWIWDDLISARRLADAKAMERELSSILNLPFERDLFLLFSMSEIRLMYITEHNIPAVEEKLNAAEDLLAGASNEALYMFHRNKGFFYSVNSDYKNGLKHYLQTLDIVSDDIKPDMAIYTNIGMMYMSIGKPYHAIMYLKDALQGHGGDRTHIIRTHTNSMLAMAYMTIGEHAKAKKLFDESLVQAKNMNDGAIIGLTLSNMSVLSIKMGNYDEGVRLCDQALEYCLGKDYQSTISINDEGRGNTLQLILLFNKGLGLLKMREFPKCQEVLEYGLVLAKDDKRSSVVFNTLKHLMSLSDSDSIKYLENEAIPYLRAGGGLDKLLALDICKEIESHYKKKRAKTKALAFTSIARDIYEEMFIGEVEL
ncbi:MAG: helix-turn-helix transcriptional regulator [Defluviitaleaceae bacterium]|nr:helix-turn-helix transcriptional regulator [Defluviitaleaceae bacterium]